MTANNQVRPERLKTLLKDLINIYSPSGKEEEILEYLEGYLQKCRLPVTRQEVDGNRYNLVVFPEDTDEVDICFIGHVDTVTAYDLDDFGFHEDEDSISGLGSADMKGGCAALVEAFTTMAAQGMPPRVGLALVVGEEEDNSGADALVREYSFPWALIAEPTDMLPCLGHYGYLEVLLRTRGKRAHPSIPQHGKNAIEMMLKLLLKVIEYASSSPGLVYNIRELSGYPAEFVIPDVCEAYLDLHMPPSSKIDVFRTELEHLVASARDTIPGIDPYIRFEESYPGYQISPDRPLVGKLRNIFERMALRWEPQDFRSQSDGNIIWAAGVDPIVLGPGLLEAAHTPDEAVSFSQVLQSARLYLDFAQSI